MTFVPQTFSSNAVLAASDLNTMDGNIDEVRSNHKGPAAPASPTAGTIWLEDDNPSATLWSFRAYDGTDWIKFAELDSSGNTFTHHAANGNFTSQLSAAAATIGTILATGVSSLGGIVTFGARACSFFQSGTLAQSESLVIVPDASVTISGAGYDIMGTATGLTDATMAKAMGHYRGTGTPTVTVVLTHSNIAFGYTANSGYWVRNLNGSSSGFRGSATRVM